MKVLMITAIALGSVEAQPVSASGRQMTADPPSQAQCPAVRDIDLTALRRQQERERRDLERRRARGEGAPPAVEMIARDAVGLIRIADWAARRPPAEAPVVIRARLPPGGGHATDHRSVVWREADGSWWFWRQTLGGPPASPPPPPPGARPGSPAWREWEKTQPPANRPREDVVYPPSEGRLSAGKSAEMEALWRDRCRDLDPAFWPLDIPLNRSIDGSRRRVCAQDSSAIYGEIIEPGRVPRLVGAACANAGPTHRMIEIAAHASSD